MCIMHENYFFSWPHASPYSGQHDLKVNYFYSLDEYILHHYKEISTGMYSYNFVFPNVSLFF